METTSSKNEAASEDTNGEESPTGTEEEGRVLGALGIEGMKSTLSLDFDLERQ